MVGTWKNKDQAFVITATKPNSVAGEAYRSLRTSLQFAALDGLARVILVTSAGEAEGKSATVANLGVVLATAGERVAIVSCDLRRPRLAQFFGLDEQVGLTTVLLGRCRLQEALQPVPGIDGLTILPTGERPSDPTGVLASHQLAWVLEQLSNMFDRVLVDSPPLLPVTDAVILSQAVDTTLLVVAAGQTRGEGPAPGERGAVPRARQDHRGRAERGHEVDRVRLWVWQALRVRRVRIHRGGRQRRRQVRIHRGGRQRRRHPAGWRGADAAQVPEDDTTPHGGSMRRN